jgi:hypothetical protein
MTDTHIASQPQHVPLVENIANQTVAFSQMKMALFRRHDTGGVLAAMLQVRQCVVKSLIYSALTNDSDNSTHDASL